MEMGQSPGEAVHQQPHPDAPVGGVQQRPQKQVGGAVHLQGVIGNIQRLPGLGHQKQPGSQPGPGLLHQGHPVTAGSAAVKVPGGVPVLLRHPGLPGKGQHPGDHHIEQIGRQRPQQVFQDPFHGFPLFTVISQQYTSKFYRRQGKTGEFTVRSSFAQPPGIKRKPRFRTSEARPDVSNCREGAGGTVQRYCPHHRGAPAAREAGTSSTRWLALPRKRRPMSFLASTKGPSTSRSSCSSSGRAPGRASSSSKV